MEMRMEASGKLVYTLSQVRPKGSVRSTSILLFLTWILISWKTPGCRCQGDAGSICRFGNVSEGCAVPCLCDAGCNKTTGECYGECPPDIPDGFYTSGPGCRIGNKAINKKAVHRGGDANDGFSYSASLTVDGGISTSFKSRTCSLNAKVSKGTQAWLYIDLQKEHRIQAVTIVNRKYTAEELTREDYFKRGGNFTFGMTNVSAIGDNILEQTGCFRFTDSIPDGGNRTFFLSSLCTHRNVGQRFFIYRNAGAFHQHIMSLCEVILQGYETIDCSHCNNSDCNDLTGCSDCGSGYLYPDCKQSCIRDTWGQNCELRCERHCRHEGKVCDNRNGSCFHGCEDNQLMTDWWTGEMCNISIPYSVSIVSLKAMNIGYQSVSVQWMTNVPNVNTILKFYGFMVLLLNSNDTSIKEMQIQHTESEAQSIHLRNLTSGSNYTVYISLHRIPENGSVFPIYGSNISLQISTLTENHEQGNEGGTSTTILASVIPVVLLLLIVGIIISIVVLRHRMNEKSLEKEHLSNPTSNKVQGATYENVALKPVQKKANSKGNHKQLQRQLSKHEVLVMEAMTGFDNPGLDTSFEEDQDKKHEPIAHLDTSDDMMEIESDVFEPVVEEEDTYVNVEEARSPTRIQLDKLDDYIDTQLDSDGLKAEYQSLPEGQHKDCTVALKYRILNRYKNILPYDKTRVVLGKEMKKDMSYINASYMRGFQLRNKSYIACQGPKKETVDDMWRMLWQIKVNTVVMVTKLVEMGRDKCYEYWPSAVNKKIKYGLTEVTFVREETLAYYTIRTLKMSRDTESRILTHFQYTGWPDKTAPSHPIAVLEFLARLRREAKGPAPIVVHCSAGIGRTGTLIAIDILLQQARNLGSVDVFQTVSNMRLDRGKMVQNHSQYAFIYLTLSEWYRRGDTGVSVCDYASHYTELFKEEDIYTNISMLEEHYETVCACKPSEEVFISGEDCTETKNRNPDILPDERHRVKLFSDVDGNPVYINAVYVSTYLDEKGLIVTQTPLPTTHDAFWRLVFFTKPIIIIMLQDIEAGEEPYWPDGEEEAEETYGSVAVTLCGTESGQMDVKAFVLTNIIRREEEIGVRHIHIKEWQGDIPSESSVLDALEQIEHWREQIGRRGPVLIHCRDGSTRSGVLAAAVTIIEKINGEDIVDVSSSVSNVCLSRPQFISDVRQYKFLHKVASKFLKRHT